MTRIAVFMSENCYPPNTDDALLVAALRDLGAEAVPSVWSAPKAQHFDAGIVRSTWDYAWRASVFRGWLESTASTLRLFNPLPTLLWSMDKRYLLELEAGGASTIPTVLTCNPTAGSIRAAADTNGWSDIVMKSVVSAGGRQVARAIATDPPSIMAALEKTGVSSPVLVQPFVPEIDRGEYSLIFLDGAYSHAVLKTPASGAFLVQEHYGGSVKVTQPPADAIAVAERALDLVANPWIYARVDLVVGELSGPMVVEIELLEPDLFLRYADGSAERLAQALLGRT